MLQKGEGKGGSTSVLAVKWWSTVMNTDPLDSSSNPVVLIYLFYEHSNNIKVFSVHAMKAYMESKDIGPVSLNLGAI